MKLVCRSVVALAALGLVLGALPAALSAREPDILEPVWSYSLFGDRIGAASMQQCDLGSDGRVEFVFDDRDRLVLVGWPAASNEPRVLGRSQPLGAYVSETAVWFDGAGWRVAVLLNDDSIAVLELPSFEMIVSGVATFNAVKLEVANVMNGPAPEIILVGYDHSAIHDSTTLDELLPLTLTASGASLAVGNVDGDPALELVFSGGAVVEIRDGLPLVEWTVPTTGNRVVLAELDGSPPLEIVMGGNSVAAYSAGNPTALWGYAGNSVSLVSAADLTLDGRQEVIVAAGFYDQIWGLHPTLGQPIWTKDYSGESCELNPSSTIPIAGDLDGDGTLELVWPSEQFATYFLLCAADAWSGDFLWRSEHHEGPVRAIGSADVEGDGMIERLAAVSGNRVAVLDAGHPTPRSVFSLSEYPGSSSYHEIAAISSGDVDRDGHLELVFGGQGYSNGAVVQVDGATLEYERGSWALFQDVTMVDIADLDGDNWPEIAIGASGDSELVIAALEGATAELEWSVSAPGQGQSVQAMMVGEVDGDHTLEIVAVGSDDTGLQAGSVVVVDVDTMNVRWSSVLEFYGLDLADLDGDGVDEILTGSQAGEIVALEVVGAVGELWRIPVAPTRLVGVRSYRDDQGRLVAVVFTEEDLFGIDLGTAEVIWMSSLLAEDVGSIEALDIVEMPGQKTPALLVGTSSSIQEIRPWNTMVFVDGFESGGSGFWSVASP